jgi:hypothetical protein
MCWSARPAARRLHQDVTRAGEGRAKDGPMRREQKIVAVGAVSGIVTMLAALIGLSHLLHGPQPGDLTGRLASALRWDAVAILPLFLAIGAVGNARFGSEAIDPLAGKESRAMVINGRVVDNTLQQYMLFLLATLSLVASGGDLALVKAAAVIFVVARFAFWIGYRIHPLYRAFGMSSTAYLSLALFAVAIWRNLSGRLG